MKDQAYSEIICANFCRYFKAGKEELKCGGYAFLTSHLTLSELKALSTQLENRDDFKNTIPQENKELFELVCKKCEFLIDGCDYRDGVIAPPCGGYILLDQLIRLSD